MPSESLVNTLLLCRGYLASHIAGLTEEQLLEVPEGNENNILWHMGHLLVSHCGMTYGRCGLDYPCPREFTALFKGGSKPADWSETPDIAKIKGLFKENMNGIVEHYKNGDFENYDPQEMAPGMSLANIEEALGFVIIHESVHHGNIITIRRLIGCPPEH